MATQTDSQLVTAATVIQNETVANTNTATRVGNMLNNIIDSKINNDKIVTTVSGTSNTAVPSVNAVKLYADTKQTALGFTPEDVANKDTDVALAANSDVKYPSQKAVKAYADTKQAAIGYTPENQANKSTNIATDTGSNIKYPSVKAVQDAIALIPTSALPYKLYSILFAQAGSSNPSVTILRNDLTGTPTVTRVGLGAYAINLSGAFPQNKTVVEGLAIDSTTGYNSSPCVPFGIAGTITGTYTVRRSGVMGDEIMVQSYATGVGSEDISVIASGTLKIYLEIKVYP